MRESRGLNGYSTTGTWVVRSGDRLIGPFNGRAPALRMRKSLRLAGYEGVPERLWSPAEVGKALAVRAR